MMIKPQLLNILLYDWGNNRPWIPLWNIKNSNVCFCFITSLFHTIALTRVQSESFLSQSCSHPSLLSYWMVEHFLNSLFAPNVPWFSNYFLIDRGFLLFFDQYRLKWKQNEPKKSEIKTASSEFISYLSNLQIYFA